MTKSYSPLLAKLNAITGYKCECSRCEMSWALMCQQTDPFTSSLFYHVQRKQTVCEMEGAACCEMADRILSWHWQPKVTPA